LLFATIHRRTKTLSSGEPNETEDTMKKILAIALLSFALSACESGPADNSNSNKPADTPAAVTPAAVTPTPAASPAAQVEIKAGDKVKVTISGVATEATVVSVDEKAGKATVKVHGQKEDKVVALSDILKP
jgi:transcription antitermination factor NusG